ncbi:MAG TPA: cyclic-phosphate processing receiver domain-containing protein [Nitrososphaeraceae archaeon]|nr:cyclic-phosphate processing receiver domain-containing protein [Nitrososphaeraceae archaeon]
MSYNLFLDDIRCPEECVHYMHRRIGPKNPLYIEEDWKIARNFDEFIYHIQVYGLPKLISFDHDLADIHYNPKTQQESFAYNEKTGYDCAKWLINYCIDNKEKLPEYFVHSMNLVGTENILNLFKSYEKTTYTLG